MIFPATRRNGICLGSLWKQHTPVAVPPNLSSFPLSNSSSHQDALAQALDKNERSKTHDYCVLVGNTLMSYTDIHAYRRGDHPTSEVRIVGASAWNSPGTTTGKTGSSSNNSSKSILGFSANTASLASETTAGGVGPNSSSSSASVSVAPSGPPTFRIVTYAGTHIYCFAPSAIDRDTWLAALHSGLEATYASYSDTLSCLSNSQLSDSKGMKQEKLSTLPPTVLATATDRSDLPILTPPAPKRGAKLQKQLQRRASGGNLSPPVSSHGYRPPYDAFPSAPLCKIHCSSCGRYPPEPAMRYSSTPLSQYGMESRSDVCQDCLVAQGLLNHVQNICGLYGSDMHERAALTCACDAAVKAVEAAVRDSEEERRRMEFEKERARLAKEMLQRERTNKGKDVVEREEREKTRITREDMFRHKVGEKGKGETEDRSGGTTSSDEDGHGSKNSSGDSSSWTNVDYSGSPTRHNPASLDDHPPTLDDVVHCADDNDEDSVSGGSGRTPPASLSGSWMNIDQVPPSSDATTNAAAWVNLPPTEASTRALLKLIKTPEFATYRRRSRALDDNCRTLESGGIGCAAEFLETLNECAKVATAAPLSEVNYEDELEMKKEALKVSGDMGAVMKLLYDNALPPTSETALTSSGVTAGGAGFSGTVGSSTEMLAVILEFLLDLCDEGELTALAFFWPQMRQIHMEMLPPLDADMLVRVELFEDFLLTVCAKYSVQLALDLVWGLIADLEESLGSPATASVACLRRRYAVLRFVCELESILFDFDGGWGGGSISLRSMLSPSQHQGDLVRDAMSVLQYHRRFGTHCLTRSVRLDKLRRETAEENFEKMGKEHSNYDSPLTQKKKTSSSVAAAMAKMQIAKNADYFSSHLMFSRRLGDIAEKLRFMDVEKRALALERELDVLNSSGRMGGDPMNIVSDFSSGGMSGLSNVVNVPSTEGHVFRSKERTPVLLLMEILRDEDDHHSAHGEDENECKGEEECKGTVDSKVSVCDLLDISSEVIQANAESSRPATPPPTNSSMDLIDSTGDMSSESPSKTTSAILHTPSGNTAVTAKNIRKTEDLIADMMHNKLDLPDFSGKEEIQEGKDVDDIKNSEEGIRSLKLNPPPGSSRSERRLRGARSSITASQRRVTPFGSIIDTDGSMSSQKLMGPAGEGRREVLTTIMVKGMRGNNIIAKGAAPAARRAVQAMDRQRAQSLIADSPKQIENFSAFDDAEDDSLYQDPTSQTGKNDDDGIDEDEAMESLRLFLIQNQVAQGKLSAEKAAKALSGGAKSRGAQPKRRNDGPSPFSSDDDIDAGDFDPRLAGCGKLSPTVLQALQLWKDGQASKAELLEIVQKDLQYLRHSSADHESKLMEDSAFWGRFAFGERWAEKKARIAASSIYGSTAGWDLVGIIVKSNDDLRQEAFVMQLIELCQGAFDMAGLELWVHPYRIVATGRTTGIIEMVRNAMSFDSLKKRPGYGTGGLREHLKRMTEYAADPMGAFKEAQRNFVRSLAAYSLMSYLFLFKDRHNGNILLDTAGHVIHIDFGFVFGIAPGGSFSLEQSVPFKVTDEMLIVMGGINSPLFSEFVTLFCCGFLALQAHADTFLTVVEITCKGSTFKCFEGKDSAEIVAKLQERFCLHLDKESTIAFCMDLIKQSISSYGTRQYDYFQYLTQGIAA